MMELLKKIYPLKLAPVSEDADKAVGILKDALPFKVHEFPSGLQKNGWIVPQKWAAKKALLYKNNKVIYDGMRHPLGVAGYSTSFKGVVPLNELKRHLFYHIKLPHALVYHCDYYYKQWKRDWGLSVPYNFFKSLKKGDYFVDIKTETKKGSMKVLDYFLPGRKKETIILNAHNCHAGQANDDISGVVVAIEVANRLRKRKNKYSYRVIIAPEHLGTVFYLANMPRKITRNFKCAIFLEMLGNVNNLSFQESFTGQSQLDDAAGICLKHSVKKFRRGKFRTIIGNDETVWESAGYEIPCVSLSRWPYDEYHSDFDTESIVSGEKLEESVSLVIKMIDILETNTFVKRKFNGLIALSNPKYDLYVSNYDPSLKRGVALEQKRWNYFLDCAPRYFDGKTTILEMALKHDLDYFKVYEYLKRFEAKRLISFGE